MCDSNIINDNIVTITSDDMNAAQLYARNRLLKEKIAQLKNPSLSWKNSFDDGTVSYRCPQGLTCYEGKPVISSKDECKRLSNLDIGNQPSVKSGWYLEWRGDNCYAGDFNSLRKCKCNFGDFDENSKTCKGGAKKGLLWYDDDTNGGKCLLTKDYCDAYGFNNYHPGNYPNGAGGQCDLTTGTIVAEAIFGDTLVRGVFGKGCF